MLRAVSRPPIDPDRNPNPPDSAHQGASAVSAYFPAGTWYDAWDEGGNAPAVVAGPDGRSERLDAPLGAVPVHYRGGVVLPLHAGGLTTAAARASALTLVAALPEPARTGCESRSDSSHRSYLTHIIGCPHLHMCPQEPAAAHADRSRMHAAQGGAAPKRTPECRAALALLGGAGAGGAAEACGGAFFDDGDNLEARAHRAPQPDLALAQRGQPRDAAAAQTAWWRTAVSCCSGTCPTVISGQRSGSGGGFPGLGVLRVRRPVDQPRKTCRLRPCGMRG